MFEELFIDRLLRTARAHPDRVAIEDGVRQLRAGELVEAVERCARRLRARGVGPEQVVALDCGRTVEQVLLLLGVWRARGATLLLDPLLPEARRQQLAQRAGARCIIDTAEGRRLVAPSREEADEWCGSDSVEGRKLLAPLEAASDRRASDLPESLELPPGAPDQLAYVVFSSGSSGEPKGVLVEQRGLVPLLEAQVDAFGLAPRHRALLGLHLGFDATYSDLGTALLSGATLVLADLASEAPATLLARLGVTHADLPPSLLRALLPSQVPPCLETLIVGGEPSDPALLRAFAAHRRVVNVYGPTEATVCTSLCLVDPERWRAPLLGHPLPHVQYRIVDEELWIGGPALARGYLDPRRTEERFVLDAGERWFRTGDRVACEPDGALRFAGRIDRQLKLHGRLIAPEELEAALCQLPEVRAALAGLGSTASGRPLLVARIEPAPPLPGAPPWDRALLAARLLGQLRLLLPRHLVPHRLEVVAALPRLPSGKLDPASLEAPLPDPVDAPVVAPASSIELLLVELWQELLGGAPLGVTTPLGPRGADSLAAIELCVAAERRGAPLPLGPLVAHDTIRAQAAALDGTRRATVAMLAMRADALPRQLDGTCAPSALPTPALRRARLPGALLLTGATGHLGPALLAALSRALPDRPRLRLLRRPAPPLDGWRDVRGDLAQPRLGLSNADFAALGREVSCIVHGGAAVHLGAPWEALAPVNVDGTRTLLALAQLGPSTAFHYLSSLSVLLASGAPDTLTLDETTPLEALLHLDGGYAQTKWAAERLVAEAAAELATARYRLGLIPGAPHDLFARLVRGLAVLGRAPEEQLDRCAIDVTALDGAVEALASLVASGRGLTQLLLDGAVAPDSERSTSPVWHLAASRPVTLRALIEALTRAGQPVVPCSQRVFRELLSRSTGEARLVAAGLLDEPRTDRPDGLSAPVPLFLSRHVSSRATRLSLGPALSEGLDRAPLDRLVRAALAGRPCLGAESG